MTRNETIRDLRETILFLASEARYYERPFAGATERARAESLRREMAAYQVELDKLVSEKE